MSGMGRTRRGWRSRCLACAAILMRWKRGTGTTKLPCANDDTPIPLMEHDHTGPHGFAFVLCFGPKPPADQDGFMLYATDHRVTVMQVNMRVKP